MWTRPGRILFAAIAAVALVWGGSAQAQHEPAVKRVLDRARAASGGAAWSKVAGLHEVGSEAGLRYERWVDPLRYGVRTEVQTPTGKVVRGFNGYGAWSLLPTAADRAAEAPPVLAEALSDAFFSACGYFFPSRFDVRAAYVGVRRSEGRAFDVLRIHPNGGKAREVWFDRGTGLAGRLVETSGPKPLSVEMSDYRRVGSLMVPFRFTTSGGDLARPRVRQAEVVDVRRVDREMFSLPRPKGP
jgi:hypothetical protein